MFRVKANHKGANVQLYHNGFGLDLNLNETTPQHYLELLFQNGHPAVTKEKQEAKKDKDEVK